MLDRGFTLLELIITLTVTLVLMGIAVPSFSYLTHRYQTISGIDKLASLIHLARQQAIQRGQTMTLCPSRDGKYCSTNWSDGQILFVDQNHNGKRDEDEPIVYVQAGTSAQLYFHAFPSNRYLRLAANGFSFFQNGTFIYCPANSDPRHAHAIFISQSGRLHTSIDSDQDGIEEDEEGKPLVCS